MAIIKPTIPKGTRDFSPLEMVRRNYIFETISSVFKKYGYQEIQTPTMENLDTLTGKYGDEGDKLIFKILESGEYLSNVNDVTTRNLNQSSLEGDVFCLFKNIAKDFAVKVAEISADFQDFSPQNVDIIYSALESNQLILLETKTTKTLHKIKDVFINYLLSKGFKAKFANYRCRLEYYYQLSQNTKRISEIKKGFKYLINHNHDIEGVMQFEVFTRKLLASSDLTRSISKKALRYDLTVPFARYVVMHQNDISFPFKRFQIQPVWRADRPQKGRYREFYQCDADVVGSDSLLNEAEFVLIYHEALTKLGLKDFTIKINNRKILSGIAEIIGKPDLIVDMTVAIDKLDKIGFDGVTKELIERGFTAADIDKLKPVILLEGTNESKIKNLKSVLKDSAIGLIGIVEIETIISYLASLRPPTSDLRQLPLELDITLARGLNYYTGAIFEVKTNEVAMGSIGGGGRYDDLTGMFGLKDLTGVGISFGADRIYDVLEELNLFPETSSESTRVMISNFDAGAEKYALPLLQKLRDAGINSEIYPSSAKLKKQLNYADDKKIPFVILVGSEEMESGLLSLKNMKSGEQQKMKIDQIIVAITV